MERKDDILDEVTSGEYKYGFVTDIDTETFPKGLSEEVVRRISRIKGEPGWMTDYRLKAYRHWLTLTMPRWPHLDLPEIDFQDISYYAAPKKKPRLASMDEVDPELKATFDKLGVPLEEQMLLSGVAVDAVMDSVSVKTTFRDTLAEKGIVFCSFSEALREHPDLVRRYMGSVVPYTDNFFAAHSMQERSGSGRTPSNTAASMPLLSSSESSGASVPRRTVPAVVTICTLCTPCCLRMTAALRKLPFPVTSSCFFSGRTRRASAIAPW